MDKYYINLNNEKYSKEKFTELMDSHKSDKESTDISEMPYDIEFLISVMAAVNDNKEISYNKIELNTNAINQWNKFNEKVLSEKNINTVYVENSARVFNSLVWIVALKTGKSIVFSETPVEADMAVVSLPALISESSKFSNYKAVISVGIEEMDFNKIKPDIQNSLWINYYAFPYCFCVSYSQNSVLGGKKGLYHQLKPVAGFDTKITDKNGNDISYNINGFLKQTISDENINNGICCTLTTDGKIYAKGFDTDKIYTDNILFEKSDIEDILLRSNMITDCAILKDKVFFSQKFSYSEYQMKKIISESNLKRAASLKFIEVPYIPYKNSKADFKKLIELTSDVYENKNIISALLKKEYDGDSFVVVDYENESDSILSNKNKADAEKATDDVKITGELAYINCQPVDYSKQTCKDLPDILRQASMTEQKIIYISKYGQSEQTYKELYHESLCMAEKLREYGVKKGECIVFQIPENRDFITAFWACVMIGAIVAPLGVLDDYGGNNLNTEKLYNIFNLVENSYVLADDKFSDQISALLKTDKVISYGSVSNSSKEMENIYKWTDEQIILMLFTSGSTGLPKGVGLSQRNVFARTLGEIEMYGLDSTLSDFNWMTLTHAAGIIWSHIRDTYLKAFQIQADTNTILKNPLSVLDYMSKYKSTTMWAPNFAYALIADNIDENKDYGWDLRNASNLYSGGETNVSKNLRDFLKKLAKYGLPENALIPAFGMTETSSCMTYYNEFSIENSSDSDRFIPIGIPANGHSVRITDENGNICKKGEIGKIEYIGDTITKEYYKNPEANAESFTEDGFFITGDLGYITGENVVLTGRIKEMIIVNGLNYYVQDIEAVVDEMDEVSTSYTAALSVKNNSGTEDIFIVFTPVNENLNDEDLRELTEKIRKNLMDKSGLYAKYIVPDFKEKSIRTEIGKKQRSKYRKKFEEGRYDEILRRLGILKEEPYLMKECWIQKGIQGNISDNKISIISEIENKKLKGNVIDKFVLENANLPSGEFIKLLIEHGKMWCNSEVGTKIVIPSIFGIALKNDSGFNVNASLITGFINSFNLENPETCCVQVDMDNYDEAIVKNELLSVHKNPIVLYRNGMRFIKEFRTITSENINPADNIVLDKKAILVVGGMGGIGINLCRHLLEKYNSSLLLIGRSDVNQDKLNELRQESGDENRVIYIKADASDENQVISAIEKYKSETGRDINVIINLSGVMKCKDGTSLYADIESHKIAFENAIDFEYIINSKLLTTIALKKTAVKKNIRDLIVFGSVNGIQGGSGLSAYAAANSFQNQYCNYINSSTDINMYCINWSGWYNTGMSNDIPDYIVNVSQMSGFRFTNAEENLAYFDAVVKNSLQNVIVGLERNNLKNRVEINDKYLPEIDIYYTGHDSDVTLLVKENCTDMRVKFLKSDMIFRNSDDSDDVNITELKRSVVSVKASSADMNDEEMKMAEVWKKVLHLSSVGPNDNFFELGGNSLLLTKLTYEIEHTLGLNVSIQDLMFLGTIRKLVNTYTNDPVDRTKIFNEKKSEISEDIIIDFNMSENLKSCTKSGSESIAVIGSPDLRCIYILEELCNRNPDKKIYFISNSYDNSLSEEVKSKISRYKLNSLKNNIDFIAADFTKKNFGLDILKYDKLADDISVVYHLGLNMNLISSYDALKRENIIGTNRIIEFCTYKSSKKLVFVSSLAVVKTISEKTMAECDENSVPSVESIRNMSNKDYLYSVYAADKLVENAIKNGLDALIIRCSRLLGDTVNGIIESDDIIFNIMEYMIDNKKLIKFSNIDELFTPVDILAKQIVGISEIESHEQHIYHLKGIETSYDGITEWLIKKESNLEPIELDEYINSLKNSKDKADEFMLSMIGNFEVSDDENEKTAFIKDDITKQIMSKYNIPICDDYSLSDMFDKTYKYLSDVKHKMK